MFAGLIHELKIEGKIVYTCDSQRREFPAFDEMPEISFAIPGADGARHILIDRGKIIFPFLVVDIDHSLRSKKHSVSSVPGGHHTIEHIHANGNAFQKIPGRSNPIR